MEILLPGEIGCRCVAAVWCLYFFWWCFLEGTRDLRAAKFRRDGYHLQFILRILRLLLLASFPTVFAYSCFVVVQSRFLDWFQQAQALSPIRYLALPARTLCVVSQPPASPTCPFPEHPLLVSPIPPHISLLPLFYAFALRLVGMIYFRTHPTLPPPAYFRNTPASTSCPLLMMFRFRFHVVFTLILHPFQDMWCHQLHAREADYAP